MLSKEELLRYSRQMELENFGIKGQENLKQARVLIVGVGGLGSIASLLLVGAGIGKIGLMDKDSVSLTNLHRQLIYREEQIGKSKVEMAKKNLSLLNSNCDIVAYDEYLTEKNADRIIEDYDIVVDCCDNFMTRYIINDACLRLRKPFVYSSIEAFRGQVALCNLGENSLNYRTLFPEEEMLCSKVDNNKAVIGTIASITASIVVNEVIKLFTNYSFDSLRNKLLCFDILTYDFRVFDFSADS